MKALREVYKKVDGLDDLYGLALDSSEYDELIDEHRQDIERALNKLSREIDRRTAVFQGILDAVVASEAANRLADLYNGDLGTEEDDR